MPKKDTAKTDKRVNNGKTPTWGVVKKFRGIRLTDTAWHWLKAMGGSDWIEEQARSTAPF